MLHAAEKAGICDNMKQHTINTPIGLAMCVMQPLLNCCSLSEISIKNAQTVFNNLFTSCEAGHS
jgi:hypothetical protein